MTIKKRLYISFLLILLIIIFIVGVFFYSTYNLNSIHINQNDRYDQIRRVEKLKEYNNSFAWIVLDIITDKDKPKIVTERFNKSTVLFKKLNNNKKDVVKYSEYQKEKDDIKLIFLHFEKIEKLIKEDLYELTNNNKSEIFFYNFNLTYQKMSETLNQELITKITVLQNKLDETEKEKDQFINKIKLELIVLLLISFLLSFLISSKLIREIKVMLDKLNNGVLQLLSNDENTIKVDIDKNNELSEITKNLNSYIEKQDDIIQAREELLRNISHELKTPITKGKFLVEKFKHEKSDKVVESINNIFYDMEELTSRLLQREKLNFVTLNISKFKVSTLILEALSKLSIDDESKVLLSIDDDFDIEGDLYYLTMALKNLIDNAMKYSKVYPIKIDTSNQTIYVKNIADELSNDFIYYIQPFTREPNQQSGHGLGLNIVNKIIKLHDFKLDYMYKNPYNIFTILFK